MLEVCFNKVVKLINQGMDIGVCDVLSDSAERIVKGVERPRAADELQFSLCLDFSSLGIFALAVLLELELVVLLIC